MRTTALCPPAQMLITMTGCMAIPSLPTAVYWLFLADYSQVWSLTQLFIFELSLCFVMAWAQAATKTSATGSSPWTPTTFSLAKPPGVFLRNEAAPHPPEATTPLA